MKCTESFTIRGPFKSYVIYCEDHTGKADPCAVTEVMRGKGVGFDFKRNCFTSIKAGKIVKAMIKKLQSCGPYDQNHDLYINGKLVVSMDDWHKEQRAMLKLYAGHSSQKVMDNLDLYLEYMAESLDGKVVGKSVVIEG